MNLNKNITNINDVLPELSVFLFGGNFNNSGFVYNSCGSVALLDNTDNPGLISLLFFNILAIGGRLFSRQTYK
jgi:hypothetical protein